MEERWKPIPGYEGLYSISSLGRVRREARFQQSYSSGGYPRVNLSRDGKATAKSIHILVAEAFIGPRPEGLQINHKDGVKENSELSNLEYVTAAENMQHAFRLGLIKPQRGSANGMYGKRSKGFAGRRHSKITRKRLSVVGRGNRNRSGKRLSADHVARLRAGHQTYYEGRRMESRSV